jgi:triacylglycerol lipase
MLRLALWLTLVTAVSSTPLSQRGAEVSSHPPTATLSPGNGNPKTVFVGRTLPEFDQDLFLGIKYADEPYRFTAAELKSHYASNDSNSGVYNLSAAGVSSHGNTVYYNATEYGYDCPGYGSDTTKLVNMGLIRLNEDCLNLNVIRPQNAGVEELPVMLWIFGGGWSQGATADPRYVGPCNVFDSRSYRRI